MVPDFGGFRPREISYLIAAFSPLFENEGVVGFKPKSLDVSVYEGIGIDLVHAMGCMLDGPKSHLLAVLSGLSRAIINKMDEVVLKAGKNLDQMQEAFAVAKALAIKMNASPCLRQHVWQAPPHLEPTIIQRTTDVPKRTQLYMELNALAMQRITPLLTNRALAFAQRANVRPVPLSKNERCLFFNLMPVFPLHGTEKELNDRIAQWIACIPANVKQGRGPTDTLSIGNVASLKRVEGASTSEITTLVGVHRQGSPDKKAKVDNMSFMDNLTLAGLRTVVNKIGNVTASGKALPLTAVSALTLNEEIGDDDEMHKHVETLRAKLEGLGLTEDAKDSPGLWKTWSELTAKLGLAKPWPSLIRRQLLWCCRVII